jgi:uncharacterized membrane protein YdjX (TVP38/TMEM64 family)
VGHQESLVKFAKALDARKLCVLAGWVTLVIAWFVFQRRSELGPLAATQRLIDLSAGRWWAVLAFLLLSVVRPLVLFPATLLTLAAGLLFGPIVGVIVAAAGANAAAMVGWAVARYLAPSGVSSGRAIVQSWSDRLHRNSFEAVLLMRLLFLPYDLVNYGCGLLKVKWRPFILATAIGSLPGTIAFVLAGASVKRLDDGTKGISAATLAVSVGLIAVSIATSRLLKKRQGYSRGY